MMEAIVRFPCAFKLLALQAACNVLSNIPSRSARAQLSSRRTTDDVPQLDIGRPSVMRDDTKHCTE